MQPFSREITFDAIINFRDLGGYRTDDNRAIAWRKLFRGGFFQQMTERDLTRLKKEIRLTTVIDLRRDDNPHHVKEVSLLNGAGIKYFNTPFPIYSQEELRHDFSNMGEVYLFRLRHKDYAKTIIDALENAANPENHPLLFHCTAGKDRTGVTAAFVLSVLGVSEVDIISDYVLSAPYMEALLAQVKKDPGTPEDIKNLPDWTWEATPFSMAFLLSSLKSEFGSARKYLQNHGATNSLFDRLKKALVS